MNWKKKPSIEEPDVPVEPQVRIPIRNSLTVTGRVVKAFENKVVLGKIMTTLIVRTVDEKNEPQIIRVKFYGDEARKTLMEKFSQPAAGRHGPHVEIVGYVSNSYIVENDKFVSRQEFIGTRLTISPLALQGELLRELSDEEICAIDLSEVGGPPLLYQTNFFILGYFSDYRVIKGEAPAGILRIQTGLQRDGVESTPFIYVAGKAGDRACRKLRVGDLVVARGVVRFDQNANETTKSRSYVVLNATAVAQVPYAEGVGPTGANDVEIDEDPA